MANMPGEIHQGILHLLRACFEGQSVHAFRYLEQQVGYPFPEHASLQIDTSTILPQPELRPDLTLQIHDKQGKLVQVLLIEVQRQWDPDKLFAWPAYAMSTSALHKVPADVLVVTQSLDVARRSLQGTVFRTGSWKPYVLGPDTIPLITDPQEAVRSPELTLLSVFAHSESWEGIETAFEMTQGLDNPRREIYFDYIWQMASAQWESKMQQLIQTGEFRFTNPWSLAAEERGKEKGRTEGEARGKVEGEAKALITIVEAKGWTLPDPWKRRVAECKDLSMLDGWVRKAVTATALEQVFSD